jgi:hypothetical protein
MNYTLLILIIVLFVNCSRDSSKISSNNEFKNAIDNYTNCQTNYEIKYNHKPTIDIKNATQIIGLAKDVSDFLRGKCYDTYYGNWNLSNSDINSYIIIDNLTKATSSMIDELKIILDFNFDVTIKYPECNNMPLSDCIDDYSKNYSDITLIIGNDYKKNEIQ